MVFMPDATTRGHGSVLRPADAVADLRHRGRRHPPAVQPRPALHRRARPSSTSSTTGIGDTAYFGPEPEFFIFDDVRFNEGPNTSFYEIDSTEGRWNAGKGEGPNLGYKPAYKGGYFPAPPTDTLTDIRNEMALALEALGIPVEVHHHEVASGGQCELSHALQLAHQDGGLDHVVQVRRQERRPPPRQDRDVHAQADLRRQRLGHALPPVDLEGREEPVRRRQVRRPVRHGAELHRRPAQARPLVPAPSPTRA